MKQQRKHRLRSSDSKQRIGLFFFLARMRGMISADGVDSSIPYCIPECSSILLALERRLHDCIPFETLPIMSDEVQVMRAYLAEDPLVLSQQYHIKLFSAFDMDEIEGVRCIFIEGDCL